MLSVVLALTLLLGTAGGASAHDSGYCGHGVSGWWPWQVHFESSFNASAYVHYHVYGHYYITFTGDVYRAHGDVKRC